MIQCVNELPKLRDKSESMYRRLLVIPFDKRFQGCERKYIKDDYLNRQDVLEYVLYRVLAETDYYELAEPDACSALLDDFRVANDPCASSRRDFPCGVLASAPVQVPVRPVPPLVPAQSALRPHARPKRFL